MEKTNTPILAGTLSIISAVFGCLGGLMFIGMGLLFMGLMRLTGEPDVDSMVTVMMTMYVGIGIVLIIAAVVAAVGGIFTFKRRHWGLALTGAIASIIAFFPTGVPSVVFTAQSKDEFNKVLPEPEPEKIGTDKSTSGGIMMIVSAVFGLMGAVFMVFYSINVSDMFFPMMGDVPAEDALMFAGFTRFFQMIYLVWGGIYVVAAILALIGGVKTLKRQSWGWSLIGAIASVFAFFPVGIAAVILAAQSKDELEQVP